MRIKAYIPNTITCCNLLSGCIAIYFAFHAYDSFGGLTGLKWCWICVAAAAVFDFCDGAAARLLKAFSPLGKDLDSLSDLVSFGVAPALMILNVMQHHAIQSTFLLSFFPLMLGAFGALRLAKFNNDTTQTSNFRGLPIPANAIFWIGVSAWICDNGYPGSAVMAILVVVMCGAMVGNFPMYSLKFKSFDLRENFSRYAILLAALLFLIFNGVAGLVWAILFYFLVSFLRRRHLV